MSKRWIAGLLAMPLALTLSTGVSAQEEVEAEKKEMKQERVEVELEQKNDSDLSGTAVISHAAEQEDAHEIALHIEGADPGESYPAHIHTGTCAEPGPVVMALEPAVQNMEGRATSNTVVTRAQFAEATADAEAQVAEREKTMEEGEEYAEARAEAEMAKESEAGVNYVIQVHLPGGTPAACGELPEKKHDDDHGKKKDE